MYFLRLFVSFHMYKEQLGIVGPLIIELFSCTHKIHGKEDEPWIDKKS